MKLGIVFSVALLLGGAAERALAESLSGTSAPVAAPPAWVQVTPGKDLLDELKRGAAGEVARRAYCPTGLKVDECVTFRFHRYRVLRLLSLEFGGFEVFERIRSPRRREFIVLGVRLPPDDLEHGLAVYRVEFSQAGPGYVILEFDKRSEYRLLRSVLYGLDPDRAGAQQFADSAKDALARALGQTF